ncbi:MAG TPA: hypothetical protein VF423_04220 [Actinomycetes bacterium]
MRAALRVRQVMNVVNLSTPLGLLVALAGRAGVTRGPDGLLLARGYRLPVPTAPAFTLGNVVVVRDGETLVRRPRLLTHEARHATQYAWCVGPVMLPLYGVAAAWSWLRSRDYATSNVFERLAGLEDGGYRLPPTGGHDQHHV